MADKKISNLNPGTPPYDGDTEIEVKLSTGSPLSRRARLDDLGGVLVASGSVSSLVAGVVLSLPAGYRIFQLSIANTTFNVSEILTAAFSYDGGVTYNYDNTTYNAYNFAWVAADMIMSAPGTLNTNSGSSDSLVLLSGGAGYAAWDSGSPFGIDVEARINPGSTDQLASMFFESVVVAGVNAGDNKWEWVKGWAGDSGGFAQAPDPRSGVRATHILLQPYGDGAAPQGAASRIATMDYRLVGFK